MRNFNALEQGRQFQPYAYEKRISASSPTGLSREALKYAGGIAAKTTLSDPHHVELHGLDGAFELSKLEGSQKLTNSIHMIGQHMTDQIDARIAKIRRSQLRISTPATNC